MKLQFYPLDIDSIDYEGSSAVRIFGRTKEGKRICIIDNTFKPYFYAIPIQEELTKIKWNIADINGVQDTKTVKKRFFGEEVNAIQVIANESKDVPTLRHDVKRKWGIQKVLESDIPFYRRYLIDKKITTLSLCEVEGEELELNLNADLIIKASSIKQIGEDIIPNPKVLAFDIETYNIQRIPREDIDPIVMIGFTGSDGFKKVLTWKKFKSPQDYVEFSSTEKEMIERFKEIISEYSPDYIVGYFSDGFDFPYLKKRADINKIRLDINLDNTSLKIAVRNEVATAKTHGIVHLDIFKFISRTMTGGLETDSYDLDSVAKELLGEGKSEANVEELADAWDNHPERLADFCEYNLKDTDLTLKIFNKVLPGLNEFVKLVGQPIYEVCRMSYGQLVEWFIIRKAQEFNELTPDRPKQEEIEERRLSTFEGAFVLEPEAGIYNNIVVFDFKSLYPSIITSHNISPLTLRKDNKGVPTPEILIGKDKIKYYFDEKKEGMLPTILKEVIIKKNEVTAALKKDKNNATLSGRKYALKILANSFYGYYGFAGARWYCLECAAGTTAYGRDYIQKVIKKAQDQKFKVVYGDSLPYDRKVFIKTPNNDIKLIEIGKLYSLKSIKDYKTLSYSDGKVKFTPIVRVIRHNYPKKEKLLKIITKYGTTIVTPQHSVYSYDKFIQLVDAKELKKGDSLLSLTNPEVEVKFRQGYVFDLANLDLGDYKKKLRFYKDNLRFSQDLFKKCPYCNKVCYLASHINAKHNERKQIIRKNSNFKLIGAVNSRGGRIPRYWKLDQNLAWLLGFYCAEGSVSDVKTKKGRKALLSFGGLDIELIKKVKIILDNILKTDLKIIKDYDARINKYMYYYRVQNLPVVALFKFAFGAGQGSEFKKVPWFIFNAEEDIKKAFIKGYLDGDGNSKKDKRYKTHFIRFCTKSKELAIGLQFLLKSLNHGKNFWGKAINHIAWNYRKDKPKINTLRVQSAKKDHGNFCLAEIRKIKKINGEKYVYDLEVADSHNFVDAEGMLLVHNTDSIFLALDKRKKEDAIKFGEEINKELPELMELDLEGFYPRGIFVAKKGDTKGAKKKYALINESGKMKITGFETIRGDWSILAREVQNKVFELILREKDENGAVEYVKDVIKQVKERKIPIAKMIISRQLRKDLSEYATVGPHVAVAKRMKDMGMHVGIGTLVRYIVNEGHGIIRERAKLPEESKNYDIEYYIDHQVLPAVDRIMEVLGYTKKDLSEGHSQSKLGDY